MKKASFVSLVLLVLTANSLVLAQQEKILLLEPETDRIQYSEACNAYDWMREAFSLKKLNCELMDLKQAKKDLKAKKLYLNRCKNPNDYYLMGDYLSAGKIVFTKLVSEGVKYSYSAIVYDMQTRTIIYEKETRKSISSKRDVYDLITRSTKELADSICGYGANSIKNDTVNNIHSSDTTIYAEKGQFRKMEKTPELIKRVAPVYPAEAKVNGIQGKVILYLLIDIDGGVKRVDIAKSSGSALLDDAAKEAALQFVFTPAIAPGNKPVRVWVLYPVNFTLE